MRNQEQFQDLDNTLESTPDPYNSLLELQISLSNKVGQDFFDSAVTQLNRFLKADLTFIGTLTKEKLEVQTISLCEKESLLKNIKYTLEGTPCENVSKGGSCIINDNVAALYPDDSLLKDLGVHGYVGISILDSLSQPVGIIVSLFRQPVQNPEYARFVFEVFSLRVKSELERLELDRALRDQRERYEFALKAGELGIYDWNIYTDETVFNSRLFEIIEYMDGEYKPTYSNWLSLVHPEDYDKLAVNVLRKISDDKEHYGPARYRIRTKSGIYKWIQVESYSFYYDAERKARRNVGIIKEIEEQVRTEQSLLNALNREINLSRQIREREKWYEFALKVGNLGVYDWYVKEDRAVFSPRLYEMIGYAEHEFKISFADWVSIVHPEDQRQFNWHSYKEQTVNQPNTLHVYRVRHKSGRYLWIEAQNMAIELDEVGHIVRMVGIVKDIDYEKRSADLLHQSFVKQKELNAELKRREEELTSSQTKLIAHMSVLKKLNKELEDKENRWKYALQSNGDGVIEWNVSTNECYFSDRAREILDFPLRDENDYNKFMGHIHPHSQTQFRSNLEACLKPPYDHFSMEVQVMDDKGIYRWIMVRGKIVELDEMQRPFKMVGTVTDLSSHKVIQKELKVYEEMIKQNQSAILFTSMNGVIEFANATAADLFEYRQHEIIGKDIILLMPERCVDHLLTGDFRGQYTFGTKTKKEITAQVATSLIIQDGESIGFVLNLMDITEKRSLENKVNTLTMAKLAAELESQRKQTEMIIQVQENEKESIARELHDGVGQLLSLAKLQLEQLETGLSPELQQQCRSVLDLMQHVATDIKGMTSDLMPLSIRNLGLESAVSSLLERYHAINGREVSMRCKIHMKGFEPDQSTAIHIYRIAQEAVNNAMKYSSATSVTLMLVKLKNSINLMVEDNGKGFDLECQLNKENSFGLKTMMERAKLIHGKLLINSGSNAGTTISLTIPLSY